MDIDYRFYLEVLTGKTTDDGLRCFADSHSGDRDELLRGAIDVLLTSDKSKLWRLYMSLEQPVPAFYVAALDHVVEPHPDFVIRGGRFVEIDGWIHVADDLYRHPKRGEARAFGSIDNHKYSNGKYFVFDCHPSVSYYFHEQVNRGTQLFLSFRAKYLPNGRLDKMKHYRFSHEKHYRC